jgi:hypothetical protein
MGACDGKGGKTMAKKKCVMAKGGKWWHKGEKEFEGSEQWQREENNGRREHTMVEGRELWKLKERTMVKGKE